jgi:plasmid maintenance system antidote protein VapI
MSKHLKRIYPDLPTYLAETGTTQTELGRLLGRNQTFISRLVNGLCQPTLHEALRIARIVGVPVESLVSRKRNMRDAHS